MYLLIQHFTNPGILEGLASCKQDQHDLTYKNTAAIEQQQSELSDLKKNMKSRLASLKTEVKGFNTQISKNKTDVATNATAIKSSVKKVQSAAHNKGKALDKAGGGLS
jgi:uncharacterized protein YlxW (UPF0749 family)